MSAVGTLVNTNLTIRSESGGDGAAPGAAIGM